MNDKRLYRSSTNYMICGVDDPAGSGDRQPRSYGSRTAYQKALESFSDLPKDSFNILLAHRKAGFQNMQVDCTDTVI